MVNPHRVTNGGERAVAYLVTPGNFKWYHHPGYDMADIPKKDEVTLLKAPSPKGTGGQPKIIGILDLNVLMAEAMGWKYVGTYRCNEYYLVKAWRRPDGTHVQMKNWMRDTPEMVKMLWVEFIGKGKGIIISPADKPGWFEVSNYTESPDGDLILNGWDTAYAITGPASWAMCAFVLKVCGKIPEYPNVFSHDDVKTLGKVEGLK